MGKSWNKNQDKYNKYSKQRHDRDRKKHKNNGKKLLTPSGVEDSVAADDFN